MTKHSAKFLYVLSVASLVGCGLGTPSRDATDSRPAQLTRSDLECREWSEGDVDHLKADLPEGYLRDFSSKDLERVHQALAGIPRKYLTWLKEVRERNGFYIGSANIGFPGGITEVGEEEPSWIKISPGARIIDLSLQHEVGHAVSPYLWNKVLSSHDQFNQEFGRIADDNYNNSNLNAYPRTYPKGSEVYIMEYFAEAFNSYYCSPETNAMVKSQFPSTYTFLAEKLEKPVWESPDEVLPSADLFVALGRESAPASNAYQLFVSVPSGLTSQVLLCDAGAVECNETAPGFTRTIKVSSSGGRDFYGTEVGVTLKDQLSLVVVGKDAGGKATAKRSVMFKAH
jgi:hypothetical protein